MQMERDEYGRQKRYFKTEAGKEARARASKRQAEKRKLERTFEAERRRVANVLASDAWTGMSALQKKEWLEQCRDVNPVMYEVLREKGVV